MEPNLRAAAKSYKPKKTPRCSAEDRSTIKNQPLREMMGLKLDMVGVWEFKDNCVNI